MELLGILTESPRSGEQIASELGVSRAAVSKAARALVDQGYPIVVDRGLGYAIAPGTPTPEALQPLLTAAVGHDYRYLGSVSSTQDEARKAAADGAPHGTVILAERQTHGRGRRARTWISVPGQSLTFSIVLRPSLPVSALGRVSIAAGVALAEAIGHGAVVKWPNDVLHPDGRKLAGVLAESQTVAEEVQVVILGIGINATGDAPEGGASVQVLDPGITRVQLLARTIVALDRRVQAAGGDPQALLTAWHDRAPMVGERVTAQTEGGVVVGIATGLDATGALLVQTHTDLVAVHAGDVIQMKETT